MTRVPKFRAWDKRHKEMFIVEDMVWSYQNNGEHYFLGIGNSITFWRDADEIELMQSTGLKDKNGMEIYEGDIVTGLDYDLDPLKGKIVFKSGCFLIESEEGDYIISNDAEVEVIGNIYENKELLE